MIQIDKLVSHYNSYHVYAIFGAEAKNVRRDQREPHLQIGVSRWCDGVQRFYRARPRQQGHCPSGFRGGRLLCSPSDSPHCKENRSGCSLPFLIYGFLPVLMPLCYLLQQDCERTEGQDPDGHHRPPRCLLPRPRAARGVTV